MLIFFKTLACVVLGLLLLKLLTYWIIPDSTVADATPTCKTHWTKCADNADLANNWDGWRRAKVDCEFAANDLAKYGKPKWPEPSFMFGAFYDGDNYIKKGIATAVEQNAQFQNAFGA